MRRTQTESQTQQTILRETRGQAFTLEAVTVSVFLLTAMTFMLQSTAVTPLTASTSNQQIEEQNTLLAQDALEVGGEQETLTELVRHYNTSGSKFEGAKDPYSYYTSTNIPTKFGKLLQTSFTDEFIAYNIRLRYQDVNNDNTEERYLAFQGEPSDNAATTTKTIFLYDNMKITAAGDDRTVKQARGFYAPDASPGPVYNVIEIEMTVWRM